MPMITALRPIASGLLAAALLAGCGDKKAPGAPTPPPAPAPLDTTIELAKGQTFVAPDQSFSVTFDQVTEESRCPAAANCIWMGQAVLALTARDGAAPAAPLSLSTMVGKGTGQVGRATVTLERVQPYPYQSGDEIAPNAYRATVRITRP